MREQLLRAFAVRDEEPQPPILRLFRQTMPEQAARPQEPAKPKIARYAIWWVENWDWVENEPIGRMTKLAQCETPAEVLREVEIRAKIAQARYGDGCWVVIDEIQTRALGENAVVNPYLLGLVNPGQAEGEELLGMG